MISTDLQDRMSTDEQLVRDYLRLFNGGWLGLIRPDWEAGQRTTEYVAEVVDEIATVRAAFEARGNGMYEPPTHDLDEVGACVYCDARRIFMNEF